jgi:glycosyltransferase involved in cell wall biosynthesis
MSEQQPKAKVAICVPSFDEWKATMGVSFGAMMACNAVNGIMCNIQNMRCSSPPAARNALVKIAFDYEMDWVLFIDSDMTFPADALIRLLSHNVNVVGCTYARRSEPWAVLGQFEEDGTLPQNGLIEALKLPTGFLLINTLVFRMLEKPWFFEMYEPDTGEDYNFCDKVRSKRIKIWCDAGLSRELGHNYQGIVKIGSKPTRVAGETTGEAA